MWIPPCPDRDVYCHDEGMTRSKMMASVSFPPSARCGIPDVEARPNTRPVPMMSGDP